MVRNEEAGGPISTPMSLSMPSGEGSRDRESGVTSPLPPPIWVGETGAERELTDAFRKQDIGRCRRRLNACSTSFPSEAASIFQKEPFPGSSCERGTFTKYRFSDRLCRIEFWRQSERLD